MKASKALFAVALLASCVAARFVDDEKSFSLIWKPTEAQVLDFKMSADVTNGDTKLQLTGDLTQKITKLEKDGGYTLETTYSNGKVVYQGQEQSMGDDDNKPTVEKFDAKGELLEGDKDKDKDDASPFDSLEQASYVGKPEKPVKKGDKWSHEFKSEKDKPAAKSDYEVLGVEKLGPFEVVKIKISYKQLSGSHPVTVEGTQSLDVKDQSVVKEEFSADNVGNGDTYGQMKIMRVRKEAASAG